MDHTSHSLLQRLQDETDEQSWQRLVTLYQPLIRYWLGRSLKHRQDVEDLTQEILSVVVRELPKFTHPGHGGAFRGWLKAIALNRLRSFWRSRKPGTAGSGETAVHQMIAQVEDPDGEMSRLWDQEHDQHVLKRLLELMEAEFEPKTIEVFRRTALDNEPAKDVAAELDMTVGAVYVAKSAVLRRLREEAEGLIE